MLRRARQAPGRPRPGRALPRASSVRRRLPTIPDRFDWQTRTPEQAGVDAAKLDAAIKFAVASENPGNKDLAVDLATSFGREPFDTPIGPVKPRGALNGLIIKNGYVVAEWGETTRVDMTFSVTKSFLSTVVGLMWQKGLIRDVTDPVRDYMPTAELFEGPHNSKITWEHLLRQTSDWQGTIWGKPDWADRPEGQTPADWPNRKLSEPGTRYKYNDARVNVLALAALQVAAPAAAGVSARRGHGADRRVEHVAVARIRELVDRPRRPARPIDDRRRPLGRRHVHLGSRHGPLRLSLPAQRQVEGSPDRLAEVDRHGAFARPGE